MNIRHLFTVATCGALLALGAATLHAQPTLSLNIDRTTGETTFVATGGNVNFDSYVITSGMDALSTVSGATGWNSLEDQFNTPNIDPEGWLEFGSVANPNGAGRIGEVKQKNFDTVTTGSPTSIGPAFNIANRLTAGFLVDIEEDLAFSYGVPSTGGGTIETGTITFSGEKIHNNLVLNINTTTGDATIKNESQMSVDLTGYSIHAMGGGLNVSFSGISGGGWSSSLNPSNNNIGQLNESGSTTLASGAEVAIGSISSSGLTQSNIEFTYTIENAGFNTSAIDGIEKDVIAAGGGSDLDSSGLVDGIDFLLWQRGFNATYDESVLAAIQSDYGGAPSGSASVGAVPEPSSIALLMLGTLALGARRKKD